MQTLNKIKIKTNTNEKNLTFDFVILISFIGNYFIKKTRELPKLQYSLPR